MGGLSTSRDGGRLARVHRSDDRGSAGKSAVLRDRLRLEFNEYSPEYAGIRAPDGDGEVRT